MISRSYDKEQIVPFIRHINLVLNKIGNHIGTPVDVLKKELRRCKSESWQNFICSRIKGVQESSRINRIFGRSPGGNLGMLCKPDGQWTTSSLEVYQHLLETHFPGSKNESESRSSQETNDMRCHKSRWLSSRSLDILAELLLLTG